jgi:carbonic anhydrase/acetyltransferase-like protein (isoleucine patch superfamily)
MNINELMDKLSIQLKIKGIEVIDINPKYISDEFTDDSVIDYDPCKSKEMSIPVKNSILLAHGSRQHYDNDPYIIVDRDKNSVVIGVGDLKFDKLIKACEAFNITKSVKYDLQEVTSYSKLIKTSKVLSKSALIYNAKIGDGCSIYHKSIIGASSCNKELSKLFGNVLIGNNVTIMYGSIIERGFIGTTEIGDNTFIGNNVVIQPDVKIGKNCYIGDGSIIANKSVIKDNEYITVNSVIDNKYEKD